MQHKPNNQDRTQLFKSSTLEKLSRTHISVPLTIYFIGCTILLYVGLSRGYFNWASGAAVFISGLFVWTFFEYMAHRHVFHMLPTTKLKEQVQYTFHGVHHEFPRDKERLAMPPAASLIILTTLFFLIQLLIGKYVYAFLPGFVVGYSLYLFVHYAVHAFKPPKNFLKVLWINHSIHHYKDDTVAYGVSSPLWDIIIGTLPVKTYKRKKSDDESITRFKPDKHIGAH